MLVNSTHLYKDSREKKYAIPAANFVDMLTAKAYTEAAEQEGLPLILAYAESHQEYLSLDEAAVIGRFYAEKVSVPVVLHLDHGNDFEFIKKAIEYGFSSVMIDASSLPYEENVRKTKEVVEYAHSKGIVVEAEIGHVGSNEVSYEGPASDASLYTTVEEAKKFAEEADVDSLAISIGTAHGTYTGEPKINFERLKEIAKEVHTPLVLHGGSSTGDLNLEKCATTGMSKINIFTDFIVAAHKAAQEDTKDYFETRDKMFEALQETLKHYYKVFHTYEYKKINQISHVEGIK